MDRKWSFFLLLLAVVFGVISAENEKVVTCRSLGCTYCELPKIQRICKNYCRQCSSGSVPNFDENPRDDADNDNTSPTAATTADETATVGKDGNPIENLGQGDKADTGTLDLGEVKGKQKKQGKKKSKKNNRKTKPQKDKKRGQVTTTTPKPIADDEANGNYKTCCSKIAPGCADAGLCSYDMKLNEVLTGFNENCDSSDYFLRMNQCANNNRDNRRCCAGIPDQCQIFCTPNVPIVVSREMLMCFEFFDTITQCNRDGLDAPPGTRLGPDDIFNFIFNQGSLWSAFQGRPGPTGVGADEVGGGPPLGQATFDEGSLGHTRISSKQPARGNLFNNPLVHGFPNLFRQFSPGGSQNTAADGSVLPGLLKTFQPLIQGKGLGLPGGASSTLRRTVPNFDEASAWTASKGRSNLAFLPQTGGGSQVSLIEKIFPNIRRKQASPFVLPRQEAAHGGGIASIFSALPGQQRQQQQQQPGFGGFIQSLLGKFRGTG